MPLKFMRKSKARPEKRCFAACMRGRRYAGFDNEAHRALNAAARFLRTLPSQALLQPRMGRSDHERPKQNDLPSITFCDKASPASRSARRGRHAAVIPCPAAGRRHRVGDCFAGRWSAGLQSDADHPEREVPQWQLPAMERRWSAVVSVDASRCAGNSAGHFEIGFLRLIENGIDTVFSEKFEWTSPSVKVAVDFWANEAVERHWMIRFCVPMRR